MTTAPHATPPQPVGEGSPVPETIPDVRRPSLWIRARRQSTVDKVLGWIWPSVPPTTKEEVEQEAAKIAGLVERDQKLVDTLDGDPVALGRLREAAEALNEAEDARRASVEARLTTTFGLASVATSLLMGVLTTFYDKGSPKNWSGIVVLVGLAYMVVQVVRAGTAAVDGLRQRSYLASDLGDLAPAPGETEAESNVRVAKHLIELKSDHAELNNKKVDCMTIAHVAARNLLIGVLVVLAVFLTSTAVGGHNAEHRWQDWEDRLKASPSLQSLLRGPPGPQGPQGAAGQTGVQGLRGEAGPRGESCQQPIPARGRPARH